MTASWWYVLRAATFRGVCLLIQQLSLSVTLQLWAAHSSSPWSLILCPVTEWHICHFVFCRHSVAKGGKLGSWDSATPTDMQLDYWSVPNCQQAKFCKVPKIMFYRSSWVSADVPANPPFFFIELPLSLSEPGQLWMNDWRWPAHPGLVLINIIVFIGNEKTMLHYDLRSCGWSVTVLLPCTVGTSAATGRHPVAGWVCLDYSWPGAGVA